jgi:glycosyltransferase involved in cell wall biosynthesis
MGAAGRARVSAEFSWTVLVGRTIALYDALCRGARA